MESLSQPRVSVKFIVIDANTEGRQHRKMRFTYSESTEKPTMPIRQGNIENYPLEIILVSKNS